MGMKQLLIKPRSMEYIADIVSRLNKEIEERKYPLIVSSYEGA